MPASSQPAPPSAAPLSAAQIQELAAARRRAGKIRSAAFVAALSGWSMAAFAALTLLIALVSFSVAGIVVGVLLGIIAVAELRGRSLLLRFDQRGPKVLALNQIALGLLILGYAGWNIYKGLSTSVTVQSGDPDVDAMVAEMVGPITVIVYGAIALYALVVPGLTAWYYHSRGRHLRRIVENTSPWVLQVLQL